MNRRGSHGQCSVAKNLDLLVLEPFLLPLFPEVVDSPQIMPGGIPTCSPGVSGSAPWELLQRKPSGKIPGKIPVGAPAASALLQLSGAASACPDRDSQTQSLARSAPAHSRACHVASHEERRQPGQAVPLASVSPRVPPAIICPEVCHRHLRTSAGTSRQRIRQRRRQLGQMQMTGTHESRFMRLPGMA